MLENMKELNVGESPFLWSSKNIRTVAPHSGQMKLANGKLPIANNLLDKDKKKRNSDLPFLRSSVIRSSDTSKSCQRSPAQAYTSRAFRSTPLMNFSTLVQTDFSTAARTGRPSNLSLEDIYDRNIEPVKPLRIVEEKIAESLKESITKDNTSSIKTVPNGESKPSLSTTIRSSSSKKGSGLLNMEIEREITLPMPVLDSQRLQLLEFCKSISSYHV